MTFKDLQQRCVIDLKKKNSSSQEQTVFYFKPETFLLEDPEKQRQYRAELLKKVGNIPKPDPITYFGDELHRSMCQIIADRSTPQITKNTLCEFFKHRQYSLQHMKYKLLCRWAHHNLTSESQENISSEATFIYGKLEYNIEQSILRGERLEQDDYFGKAFPENRPSTKTTATGNSLYVEKVDLLAQSLVREDDIEVYMRSVSHRNKLTKLVNKFISRLKWLPMQFKYQIFENAISGHFAIKQKNIDRQIVRVEKVKERAKQVELVTNETEADIDLIVDQYYCSQYEKMFLGNVDKTVHFWKGNHDEVPQLVSDAHLLKIKILEFAEKFGLTPDIELDNGYSYSYQVTVFMPSYFQKQVLKSQFSIYDSHVDEDPNEVKKRTLGSMARIDTNIFRDVSTTKHTVPSDEAIYSELRDDDIKIVRLKSAAFWINYVALTPNEPDWHQKQQAILNSENPLDNLLQAAFNFLDVNDLATVNRINEDNTQLHLRNIAKLQVFNPHNQISKKVISTNDGEKSVLVDKMPLVQSKNLAANLQAHMLNSVENQKNVDDENFIQSSSSKSAPKVAGSSIQIVGHLLTAYQTLRYIRSKDAKIKILYTLNYFRSIQKRLALDLKEFATRDRIDAHFLNPFIQSKEANQNTINQANFSVKAFEKVQRDNQLRNEKNVKLEQKLTVFDTLAIEKMKNMASLRMYKSNGFFNNKILSTCPSYPKYHATFGEPTVNQPEHEESDRQNNNFNGSAIKLMGRIEFVEINEKLGEVYIKDDFGIYIMYDCVLQDMKCLEEELCKIGSLYLHKSELLLDPTQQIKGSKPLPYRDRLELLHDLLDKESKFQFKKVKLIQVYMECYEHITDPIEQQKIMQIITDLMARRPRLNLNANYFIDAYDAEIECLAKQFELVKTLVDLQISLEKTENKRLQDSLNLSFHLANQYQKNKWQYQDADALFKILQKKKLGDDYQKEENTKKQELVQSQSQNATENFSSYVAPAPTRPESQMLWGEESSVSLDDEEFLEQEQDKFSRLLGLPKISLESIYQSYHEKDINIIKLMSEHSHFIATHEGYPEFLTRLTHHSITNKNRVFKPNDWSQETGSLDFYESLDIVTKFYAITQQMQQELYDELKMWDNTLLTQIDIQIAEFSLKELQNVISFQDGSKIEYQGRDLIEDEQILGSSDKMIFYAKELLSDLTCKQKDQLDPFIISKLDLQTIKYFDFPKIPVNSNKYTLRRKGIAGIDYMLIAEKSAISGIAKQKVENPEQNSLMSGVIEEKIDERINLRNINVPTQFKIYSNIMELHRLRSELILAVTETQVLSQIYLSMCEVVGLKLPKLLNSEGLSFELNDSNEDEIKFVNFVDHGPSHMEIIDIAIKEFDPQLLSNFNFRNPDSFKINITTSGLEEVRAALQYQVFQKHLLIVANRINCLLIDSHQRAFSELNLISQKKIAIPNSIVRYHKMINKNADTFNQNLIKSERSVYKLSLSSSCLPVFYNIMIKKSAQRASIVKEFSNHHTNVVSSMPHNEYCILRVMRSYKIKLLTKFLQSIQNEVYLDAQKVQALQSCHRLRMFNRYFAFDPKQLGMSDETQIVFKYETSQMIENFPSNYLPEQFLQEESSQGIGQKKQEIIKVFNPSSYEIIDYSSIPSSTSLLSIDSAPMEDIRAFKQKRFKVREKIQGTLPDPDELKQFNNEIIDPELILKQMLPTFTPFENLESQLGGGKKQPEEIDLLIRKKIGESAGSLLDYEEALYYGDSKYASLIRYYQFLERIITIEWFLNKLQFRADEVIFVENAIEQGLPFWKQDEFDARVFSDVVDEKQKETKNHRAYQFCHDQILSLRQKKNIAEVVQSLALTMKSFISQHKKTREDQRFEYLLQYTEFRYQQIVGSLHKLVQQFYFQKNINAVIAIRQSIAQITKMNHIKVVYLQPSNYSVSSCAVSPDQYCLESGNLIYGSMQYDSVVNFKRCVQPIINEKALEPSQVTLFQSLYQQDFLRRNFSCQFAGQFTSNTNSIPFKAMEYALLSLKPKERVYSQSFIAQAKYQANDFMETVFNDTAMANLQKEEVYNLNQLVDAKKFINETTQALLLRNALICWFENQPLPDSTEVYEKFETNFRQNYFWKQLEQKEELTKKLQQANNFGQIPSKEQLQEMKNKIDNLSNDYTLATQSQISQRETMVKALQEEFSALKKKVTLDAYFNMKAEIYVFSNEIEKFMIKASIKTLDSECNALSKCFTLSQPKIQYHIHPFQQFAATFFDQCDPNMHLDVSNRVTAVQVLLTKMRNRCTEIETLTSGPGMVFTIKDINDILQEFCKQTIKDQELQFKSRSETSHLIEENFRELLYTKDQQIKTLKHRLNNIGVNLDNIINAKMYERGNQLVYELDSSKRILSLFKDSIGSLEKSIFDRIQGEQMQKFKRNTNKMEIKDQKFKQYKEAIMTMINADWEEDAHKIKTMLKQKADFAKITDRQNIAFQKIQMYPVKNSKNSARGGSSNQTQDDNKFTTGGVVVPNGYQHYKECSCYVPDPNYPQPTLQLAALEMLSEMEARQELARMCTLVRQQRVLYRTKEMCMMTKYQDQINLLKKQLNNNSTLWEQFAESEKRERVLRQELLFTQQSLSASEKTVYNLKEEIKGIDAERVRLLNFKTKEASRLKELEVRVNKIDLFENIDTDKLLMALTNKDAQLTELKSTQLVQKTLFETNEKKREKEVAILRKNYKKEQQHTYQIIEKMEQMKQEIKMLETDDTSVASTWKKKCIEVFDVCQNMRKENEELRERCQELINHGIELAETIAQDNNQIAKDTQNYHYKASSVNVLPQLNNHESNLKMSKFTNSSSNTKETRQQKQSSGKNTLENSINLKNEKHLDSLQKMKGLSSELNITKEYYAPWGQQNSIESGSEVITQNKKIPMTQQRNRTIGAQLDYQYKKPQVKPQNDIRSIISGFQDQIVEGGRKKFGSTADKGFNQNLNLHSSYQAKRRQVGLPEDSLYNTSYGGVNVSKNNKQKPEVNSGVSHFVKPSTSITFDLKGMAINTQTQYLNNAATSSPQAKNLQQTKKVNRREIGILRQNLKEVSTDYNEIQRAITDDIPQQESDKYETAVMSPWPKNLGEQILQTPSKVSVIGQENNQN